MYVRRIIVVLALSLGLTLGLLALLQDARAAGPQVLFVVPAPGIGTPTCAQNDPCSLRMALGKAVDGGTIYLAGGTYLGSGGAVVTLTHSVALYGGWNGAPTGVVVRNPRDYPTILDGEETRRGVYIAAGTAPTLDGLRVINGSSSDNGGGIYASGAQPVINACFVYSNYAGGRGAGVYLAAGAEAMLSGNQIRDNSATHGGGLCIDDSADVLLMDNRVYDNSADKTGGGVLIAGSLTTTLDSNRIYDNSADYGGGVYVNGSPGAVLQANRIYSNTAGATGGGLQVYSSTATVLSGNQIHNNTAVDRGGGVFVDTSLSTTMAGNEIYSNTAGQQGGGLYLRVSSTSTLTGNVIQHNHAVAASGGGVLVTSSPAIALVDNQIGGNTGGGNGGGIALYSSPTATVSGNQVYSNTTVQNGGGIYFHSRAGTLAGNRFYGNRLSNTEDGLYCWGAGVYLRDDDSDQTRFVNNVVVDNRLEGALANGAGVYVYRSSMHLLHNTLARNTGGDGSALYAQGLASDYVTMTNTIIAGHAVGITATTWGRLTLNGVLWHGNAANTNGHAGIVVTGAITGDPAFAADGYHLGPGSAAIDAASAAGVTDDVDGEARPSGPAPDLGADEFAYRYVNLPLILMND